MTNNFAHLSAENPMHTLATVRFEETVMANPRVQAVIIPCDIGDEDCRKMAFDVFVSGSYARAFNTKEEAYHWCLAQGLEVE